MDVDPTPAGHSRPHQFLAFTHYLVSWLAAVHQISKENGVLGAGQPASRHLAGALLDADPLVVLIDGLHTGQRFRFLHGQLLSSKHSFPVCSDLTAVPKGR